MDWQTVATGLVIAGMALTFAWSMVLRNREIRRAKQSRWATWLDEPRDYDNDSD